MGMGAKLRKILAVSLAVMAAFMATPSSALQTAIADIPPTPQAWDHWYKIEGDTVTGTAGTATAMSDRSIKTDSGTWTQSRDLTPYAKFVSQTTMANAVFNLSMEEVEKNSSTGYLYTGTNWQKVWTRDTAMSVQNSLGWIVPAISAQSLRTKIIGDNIAPSNPANPGVFEQDTGTGGSYPNSVDRIILMLGTWEQYLASGDTEYLGYMYDAAANTILQDDHVVFDEATGLYKGETGGLDHRAKTYPNWMAETQQDGIVNITEGKSAIVNVVYAEVFKEMAKSARILGKGELAALEWENRAAKLIQAINDELWLPERGMYTSWQYPEYMGSVNADKVDVISNGYAVLFGIAPPERAESILENYPMVVYGAPTVWPQKGYQEPSGDTIYHNRGVWPGWEVTLMMGAKAKGYNELADAIWQSCIRGAAMNRTNKEVIDFSTGAGHHSDQQLWSVAGTLSGYYRVLFGMTYDEAGISFAPYVPDWIDGPFELNDHVYRNAKLNIAMAGKGDTLTSIKLDGIEMGTSYKVPPTLTGTHSIELTVIDGGAEPRPINIQPLSWVTCPDIPTLSYSNGTLSWTPNGSYTYKLWNGEEWLPVSGSSYTPPAGKYAVYSLVAVADTGVTSEMSKPIIVNPADNVIKIEAESGTYAPGAFSSSTGGGHGGFSGTGYVIDNRANPAGMTFNVTIPVGKGGEYLFNARYFNMGDGTTTVYSAIRSVYVDGEDAGTLILPLINQDWGRSTYLKLDLTPGEHTIKVFIDDANWFDRNMDINRNDAAYDYFVLQFIDEPIPETGVTLTQSDDGLAAEFTIGNVGDGPLDAICIIAVYDEGRLMNYAVTPVRVDAQSGTSFVANCPYTGTSAKAYIWSGAYAPLCVAAEL